MGRGKYSKAEDSPLILPHPGRWWALFGTLLVALLIALGRLGYFYNGRTLESGFQWPEVTRDLITLFTWVFDGAAQVITLKGGAPLAAQLFCLVLAGLCTWALRRSLVANNAHKPGAVEVRPLQSASPPEMLSQRAKDDLEAQFSSHISEAELYPPSSLPAEPPAESFLDLLGTIDKLSWSSVFRIFTRLRPKVAYRVSGVLRVREEAPRFGMTVTITAYAWRGSRTETVWGSTWQQAVNRAGCWAIAAIVPITAASKKPPWQGWRGRNLPYELFMDYQEGSRLARERRYDDALDRLYRAVDRDPKNLYLRIQIGATQEKLGLYLDALETYYAALSTVGPLSTDKEDDYLYSPWYKRLSYVWHWRRLPGVAQVHYRIAVVLGMSEKTAAQWCGDATDGAQRYDACLSIRKALAGAFAARYWRTIVGLPEAIPRVLSATSGGSNSAQHEKEWLRSALLGEWRGSKPDVDAVKLIFRLAALAEMQQLAKNYFLFKIFKLMRYDSALTRSAIRINSRVWTPLRLAWAIVDLQSKHPKVDLSTLNAKLLVRRFSLLPLTAEKMEWPAGVKKLAADITSARRSRLLLWKSHHNWQDHYNAACVYAIAMNGWQPDQRQPLARCAIEELRNASRAAEGGFISRQKAWLLYDDPDLAALREEDSAPAKEFAVFEREQFPRSTALQFAGMDPMKREMAAYDQTLLAAVAGVMERTWRERSEHAPADISTLTRWFEDEVDLWKTLQSVAEGKARHWPDRARLLQKVRQVAEPRALADLDSRTAVPEYDTVLSDGQISSGQAHLPDLDDELLKLDSWLQDGKPSPGARGAQWLEWCRTVRISGRTPKWDPDIRNICACYARLWLAIQYQFSDSSRTGVARYEAVQDSLPNLLTPPPPPDR